MHCELNAKWKKNRSECQLITKHHHLEKINHMENVKTFILLKEEYVYMN